MATQIFEVPATHLGDLDCVCGSQLWPGSVLAVADFLGNVPAQGDLLFSLSCSVLIPLCLSKEGKKEERDKGEQGKRERTKGNKGRPGSRRLPSLFTNVS